MEQEQSSLVSLRQVQLGAVRELLRATAAALPIEEVLPIIANVMIIAFDALTTWVMLAEDGRLRTGVARGEGAAGLAETTCDLGVGAAGTAALHDQPVILAPQSIDPADPVVGVLASQGTPVVLLPIRSGGQVRGLLGAVVTLDATGDLTFLLTLAEQAAVAIEDARLRAEVRTWRQRLDAVFEQMNDPVLVYDQHGRLALHNAATRQLLGPYGVQAGDSVVEIAHKAGLCDPLENLIPGTELAGARALRGEVVDNLEVRIRAVPGGAVQYLLASAVPLWHDDRLDGAVVILRDITPRREAEQALRESEARFRAVQELSLHGLTLLHSVRDASGAAVDFEIENLNPVAERVTSQASEALRGKRLLDLFPESKTSGFFDHYREVAETGRAQEFEGYYNGKGIEGWFRNMVVKLDDGVAISFSDITAQKQAEVERADLLAREQAARTEAQEAVRVRDAFLAIASHELRNVLTLLLGQSQMLQKRTRRAGTLDERDQRALQVILEQSNRLNRMITDMLDLSRIERGQLQIETQPVDLAALTRRVVDAFEVVPGRHTINCTLPDSTLLVLGDTFRLEQVIQNLLDNAVKYSPNGGVVRISLERQAAGAVLTISDPGIGIPVDALTSLFHPFYRAANAEAWSISGSGVGLYVSHEIVTRHGGTIEVASLEGQGSTFTVVLPLASSEG